MYFNRGGWMTMCLSCDDIIFFMYPIFGIDKGLQTPWIAYQLIFIRHQLQRCHIYIFLYLLHTGDTCSLSLTESGEITSPNFPANYNDMERCTYTVIAPDDKLVAITFYSFSLEYSEGCISDAVTVSIQLLKMNLQNIIS